MNLQSTYSVNTLSTNEIILCTPINFSRNQIPLRLISAPYLISSMSLDNVQVSENIYMIFRRLGNTIDFNFSFKTILIA
jgi:hypothetical protein